MNKRRGEDRISKLKQIGESRGQEEKARHGGADLL
jgi:hypothetical protein